VSFDDEETTIENPPLARSIFGETRFAWIWLLARLYVALTWLVSAQAKMFDAAWNENGAALRDCWINALRTESGVAVDPYLQLVQYLLDIQAWTWFARFVIIVEGIVGLLLFIGAFTGIVAFFSGLLNWNYVLIGAVDANPLLFALSVLLMLTWKTCGYWGLDRYLLPRLGVRRKPVIRFGSRRI
jgi:thiosulfate dehydrogenase [quinone] large subunit